MKIQDMVCTLDQAKELKGMGIEQIGLFSWAYDTTNEKWEISHRNVESLILSRHNKDQVFYSAFTTDELLAMLPGETKGYELALRKDVCEYITLCEGAVENRFLFYECGSNSVQAAAKALIYCLKNNYLTADEANKRLQS